MDVTFGKQPAFAHLLPMEQVHPAWGLYRHHEFFAGLHVTCIHAEYSLARSGPMHLEYPQDPGLRRDSDVVEGMGIYT